MDVAMKDVKIQNLLAFGNIIYSDGNAPNTIAPRLDWRDRADVIEDGEPNLFRALQWRYNMAATLRGRDHDMQSVLDWAEDGRNTLSVRLLSGPGGSGKTRLAAEIARTLRNRGWAAGFIPRNTKDTQTFETGLRKFFLVFDYPEERMDVLQSLMSAIQDIPDTLVDFPIRILLVSRRTADQWQDMMRRSNISLGRQELAMLGPLDLPDAQAMFDETAANFSELAGKAQPDLSQSTNWLEADPARRVPLVIMAAAIHQVLTGQSGFGLGATELIEALANIERHRAERVSKNAGLGTEGLPRLLSMAALTQAGLDDLQCEALAKLEICEATGQALLDKLKGTPWRQRRVGGGGFHLVRPEPDRMAASFVAQTLLNDPSPRLPDWLAIVAEPQGGAFGDVISRVEYDLLGSKPDWPEALERALEAMIRQNPAHVAAFFDLAYREATVFSARFSSLILQQLLAIEGLEKKARALLLNNLANTLSKLGHHEEALKAAQEAVNLDRALAKARPNAFTSDLARSLSNQANIFSLLGNSKKALEVAQEAVTILSPFFQQLPVAFGQWMYTMVQTYLKRCEESGRAPDDDLLGPIVQIFQQMQTEQDQTLSGD